MDKPPHAAGKLYLPRTRSSRSSRSWRPRREIVERNLEEKVEWERLTQWEDRNPRVAERVPA